MVKIKSLNPPCLFPASAILGLHDSPVCGHHLHSWDFDQHHRMRYCYTGKAGISFYRYDSLKLKYLQIKQMSAIHMVDKKVNIKILDQNRWIRIKQRVGKRKPHSGFKSYTHKETFDLSACIFMLILSIARWAPNIQINIPYLRHGIPAQQSTTHQVRMDE